MFSFKKSICGASSSHNTFDPVSMLASSFVVNDVVYEPRRSERHKIESNFEPYFIIDFLIESSDVKKISDYFVFVYLIEEDPKPIMR